MTYDERRIIQLQSEIERMRKASPIGRPNFFALSIRKREKEIEKLKGSK